MTASQHADEQQWHVSPGISVSAFTDPPGEVMLFVGREGRTVTDVMALQEALRMAAYSIGVEST